MHTLRLPPVDTLEALDTYLELLCEDLGCCEKLISTLADTSCLKCPNSQSDEQSTFQSPPSPATKRRNAGNIYVITVV